MSLLPSCTASAVEGSQYTEYFVPANEVNPATIVYSAPDFVSFGAITGNEIVSQSLSIPVSGVGTYSISVTLVSSTGDAISTTDVVQVSIAGNGTKEVCKLTGPQFFLGLYPTGTNIGINGLISTTIEDTTALVITIVPMVNISNSYNIGVNSILSIKVA